MEFLSVAVGLAALILAVGISMYLILIATTKITNDAYVNTTRFPTEEPTWLYRHCSITAYTPAEEDVKVE